MTLSEGLEALPVYMRRAHGHDQDWRDVAMCRLPRPELLTACGTVTKMKAEEAEPIVRRQVWATDTLGAQHVSILGRKMLAVEVEQLAMMVCNQCPAQWDCVQYALKADETVGTWAIPQSWLELLRKRPVERVRAAVEAARVRGTKVQELAKAVLFEGVTPR